jgi:hypothetical protein
MNFQQIILIIAIIILIIMLIIIGIALSKSTKENWPPIIGACPDYWIDISGNGSECINSQHLGTCNLPSETDKNPKNFNQPPFNGSSGNCSKYKWSKGCNVTWDGITSGVNNPCSQ